MVKMRFPKTERPVKIGGRFPTTGGRSEEAFSDDRTMSFVMIWRGFQRRAEAFSEKIRRGCFRRLGEASLAKICHFPSTGPDLSVSIRRDGF